MTPETDAVTRWMERRRSEHAPDDEFMEMLAEMLRAPELLTSEPR